MRISLSRLIILTLKIAALSFKECGPTQTTGIIKLDLSFSTYAEKVHADLPVIEDIHSRFVKNSTVCSSSLNTDTMVLLNHSEIGLQRTLNTLTPPKPLLILTTSWRPRPPKLIKYMDQVCASGWRLVAAIPVPYLHGLSLNIHLPLMLHGLLQVSFMPSETTLTMTSISTELRAEVAMVARSRSKLSLITWTAP